MKGKYKKLWLTHLPEIKAIEQGKLKALKGRQIDSFLQKLIAKVTENEN